jgi:hypothetical protein
VSKSRIVRFVAPNRVALIAHIVATLALVVAALAVVYALIPFDFLGFTCGSSLGGGRLLHGVPITSNLFGQGADLCRNQAHKRLITEIVVFILALTAGVGGWVLPVSVPWWLGGPGGPGPGKKTKPPWA